MTHLEKNFTELFQEKFPDIPFNGEIYFMMRDFYFGGAGAALEPVMDDRFEPASACRKLLKIRKEIYDYTEYRPGADCG